MAIQHQQSIAPLFNELYQLTPIPSQVHAWKSMANKHWPDHVSPKHPDSRIKISYSLCYLELTSISNNNPSNCILCQQLKNGQSFNLFVDQDYGSWINLSSATILQYSLINKYEERQFLMNPSIQIVPLLNLQSLHNTSQSTLTPSFKLKISNKFSLTNMLDDRLFKDETTRRCSTDRSNISTNELRQLRLMKVGSLSEMSEEECHRRYAEDPFFRKKLQAELRSLKKSCLITTIPKRQDFFPYEILPTVKLIDEEDKITFKKTKLNETFEQLQEKGKFQRTLSRMDVNVDVKENRMSYK